MGLSLIRGAGLGAAREGDSSRMTVADLSPETLYRLHLDEVYRYVVRRVAGRTEAEDVTAEVFGAAFAQLPKFRGGSGVNVWLLGIARRKVADSLRRRSRRRECLASEMAADEEALEALLGAAGGDGPEALARRAEARRELRRIVAGLREEQREALLLHYVEELPIAQVAAVMGRSPAATNSLLQRARAAVYREGRAYFVDEAVEEGVI